MTKYKEGTVDGFENGFGTHDYKLWLYKSTVLSVDGTFADFTDATGTNYVAKTLLWSAATVSWDAGESKYKAVWPAQTWSNVALLDADGSMISNSAGTKTYSAEAKTLGADYTTLTINPIIYLG